MLVEHPVESESSHPLRPHVLRVAYHRLWTAYHDTLRNLSQAA